MEQHGLGRYNGAADDGAPEAALGLVTLLVDAFELVEVRGGHAPQAGGCLTV